MKKYPKVAVIIPTYNRWPYLAMAVNSVLTQTYPNVKCIVVDDASTDDTPSKLVEEYGDRIKLIVQPENREKSASRNAGVFATDSDYVCMLDSDDVLTENSVEQRIKIFLNDPNFGGVAYGITKKMKTSKSSEKLTTQGVNGDALDHYLKDYFVHNNDFLLSRENMLKYGMYKEDLTNREDVELLIRLACHLPFRFSGGYVSIIRRVDSSARVNYDKIIRQGNRFSEHLRVDSYVAGRLGKRLDELMFDEARELAAAYYKSRRYRQFLEEYAIMRQQWPERLARQPHFLRRYLCSLLLSVFRDN